VIPWVGVVDRLSEPDLAVDADERELGVRRHLVDDLGDADAVLLRRAVGAVVDKRGARRDVPGGLSSREPSEAEVDHGHFRARARAPEGVPGRCVRGGDALSRD
jgi:hypothetical protein